MFSKENDCVVENMLQGVGIFNIFVCIKLKSIFLYEPIHYINGICNILKFNMVEYINKIYEFKKLLKRGEKLCLPDLYLQTTAECGESSEKKKNRSFQPVIWHH